MLLQRLSRRRRSSTQESSILPNTPRLRAPLLKVVSDCVDFLKVDIPEFVFRVPGRKDVVDDLVEKYELGDMDALASAVGIEPNDVASLFKKYLMDSISPILLRSQAQQLVRAASKVQLTLPTDPESSKNRRDLAKFNKSLRVLTRTLSSTSAAVLAKVFNFLRIVAAEKDTTKMSVHALAICFAPVFFLQHFSSSEATSKIHLAIYVTEMLISSADSLFPMYRRIALGNGLDAPGASRPIPQHHQDNLRNGLPQRRATVTAVPDFQSTDSSTQDDSEIVEDSVQDSSESSSSSRFSAETKKSDDSKKEEKKRLKKLNKLHKNKAHKHKGKDQSFGKQGSLRDVEEEGEENSNDNDQEVFNESFESARPRYAWSVDTRRREKQGSSHNLGLAGERADRPRLSWLRDLEPFQSPGLRVFKARYSLARDKNPPEPTHLIIDEPIEEEDGEEEEMGEDESAGIIHQQVKEIPHKLATNPKHVSRKSLAEHK